MILGTGRLVKFCLTDGSILKDYTSMLFDTKRPTGISTEIWELIGPNTPGENPIRDIAATSNRKWLFAACSASWAIFDVEQGKCVVREHCTLLQGRKVPRPISVAISPDDKLFYMATDCGTVESYDIQAAKTRQVKSIPNQCFVKITVDPNNQFVFIASKSGDLYKYDAGQKNQLEQYQGYGIFWNVDMLLTRDSHYLFFASGDPSNPRQIKKFSVNKKEIVAEFEGPVFKKGIQIMALSPDSNSLYVGTPNKLLQFSLKDGKVIQSRTINERPDMQGALIHAMSVTKNNQYLVTGTTYFRTPEKGTEEDMSAKELVYLGGPVCLWSTKDLTLVKTQDVDNKLFIGRII